MRVAPTLALVLIIPTLLALIYDNLVIALAVLYTLSIVAVPNPWLANALVNTGEVLLLAALLRATYHFAAAPNPLAGVE